MAATDVIYAVSAIASSLAAVLAWIAKIRWSDEYAKAKDETIKAKEAQIEYLNVKIKDLENITPLKIKEYYQGLKVTYDEIYDEQKRKLNELESKLKEVKNKSLLEEYTRAQENIIELRGTIKKLERAASSSKSVSDDDLIRNIEEVKSGIQDFLDTS